VGGLRVYLESSYTDNALFIRAIFFLSAGEEANLYYVPCDDFPSLHVNRWCGYEVPGMILLRDLKGAM
jgi:hypothetical protein